MTTILSPKLDSILEGTSRSFYLSLNQLPSGIKGQVSLLYLLARTSDTIADSGQGTLEDRLEALEEFDQYARGNSSEAPDFSIMAETQDIAAEGELLRSVTEAVGSLSGFSDSDRHNILHCLGIIISGQTLDLRRFPGEPSTNGKIEPLSDDDELDDYAYRVAGSVGEFWTRMSLDHLFKASESEEGHLFDRSVRFGKSLQMINILRDIPADLSAGRCYIPRKSLEEHGLSASDLTEPGNMPRFKPLYDRYLDLTESHFDAAIDYIGMLPHSQFRLRGSCMLPVVIGKRTVKLLRNGNVLDPSNRIKIGRADVEGVVKSVVMAVPFPGRSKRLLEDA